MVHSLKKELHHSLCKVKVLLQPLSGHCLGRPVMAISLNKAHRGPLHIAPGLRIPTKQDLVGGILSLTLSGEILCGGLG